MSLKRSCINSWACIICFPSFHMMRNRRQLLIILMKVLGPTYLTNHPTDHLQYSNNIVAKTDPTAPRTIVIIVDKIRVKTGLLFTKSKI